MMDNYKKDIDNMHAPDALIEKTLQAIRNQKDAPQEKMQQDQKDETVIPITRAHRKRFPVFPVTAAAAAVVILAAVYFPNRDQYNWSEISSLSVSRTASQEFSQADDSSVSVSEYSDFIGEDCRKLIDGCEYTDGSAEIVKEDGEVTDDIGIFYYDSDNTEVMLVVSKTHDVTPDAMADLETSRVEGQSVFLAKSGDEGNESWYASGERDGLSYYLFSATADETGFKKILKNFLKG